VGKEVQTRASCARVPCSLVYIEGSDALHAEEGGRAGRRGEEEEEEERRRRRSCAVQWTEVCAPQEGAYFACTATCFAMIMYN